MSAIGNFEEVQPPQAVLDAYAKLFAWKLSKYDIKADATKLWVKNRYLQAINGHRDVGQTACPGKYLYAQLPKIRQMAASIQKGTASTPTPTPKPTPTPDPEADAARRAAGRSADHAAARERAARPLGRARLDVAGPVRPGQGDRQDPRGADRQGQVGFTTKVLTAGTWTSYDAIVAPGDLNGDGKGDLFVRNRRTHQATVLPGNGTGGFRHRDRQVRGVRRLHLARPRPATSTRTATPTWWRATPSKRLVLLPGTGKGHVPQAGRDRGDLGLPPPLRRR